MCFILEIDLYYQVFACRSAWSKYVTKENFSWTHMKLGLNCEQSSARATSTCGCWNRSLFQRNLGTASHISGLPTMHDTKKPWGYLGGRKWIQSRLIQLKRKSIYHRLGVLITQEPACCTLCTYSTYRRRGYTAGAQWLWHMIQCNTKEELP